jgi:hypothetical protein
MLSDRRHDDRLIDPGPAGLAHTLVTKRWVPSPMSIVGRSVRTASRAVLETTTVHLEQESASSSDRSTTSMGRRGCPATWPD